MLRSLLCSLALAVVASAQTSYFSASLDGSQEVPPNASVGRGWGIVRLIEPANVVSIFLRVENTPGPVTAAHLHIGAVGVNGGIIVGLSGGPNNWSGTAVLSTANVLALKTAGTYLNAHTAAFPAGEIRGQVVAPTTTRFTAVLNGLQEVPPNGSAATGEAVAFLHQPDNRLVYTVSTTGLVAVTAAHIHMAPAGVNGGVIHTLMGGAGQYCGVTGKLTAAQLAALLVNGLYFNVHTSAFPGGEIRGQILLSAGDDFGGLMNGAQEVPPTPSPGIGNACIQILPNGAVSYRVQVAGLTSAVTAAHVHVAPAGVNGGVVFPLAGGPAVFSGTSPVLTAAQLNDCRLGNWYVNVHTMNFPGGELRGQLGPLALPTVFGGSCPGTNGVVAEISASAPLCVAGTTRIDGHGVLPGAGSILGLGFSRDLGQGIVPLPIEFTAVGVNGPGCFFLADPAFTLLVFADPQGCLHQSVTAPLDHTLIGVVLYCQWFVFNGANPGGVISSNAIGLRVQ